MFDPLRFTVISVSPLHIAVLASHEGTTLQAVLDACAGGRIPARVCLVISNNADSGALRRARAAGVPALHLSAATSAPCATSAHAASPHTPAALDEAIGAALQANGADLVLLAGYMKPLGPRTLAHFAGRVLNTHPALLPGFGGRGMFGLHVHEAVLAAGATRSGASIHLVEAGYDTGAVVAQVSVPVEHGDTPRSLAARVQTAERELLVEVLGRIARPLEQAGTHGSATQAPGHLQPSPLQAQDAASGGRAGRMDPPEPLLAGITARIAAAARRRTAAEVTS